MAPWFSTEKKNWENLAFTNREAIEVVFRRKEFTGDQQYLAGGAI